MKNRSVQFLKKNLLLIAAVTVPLLFALYWHCLNKAYPKTDESSYFYQAIATYNKLKNSGPIAWLIAQYSDRTDLKPVIISSLAAPFVVLTGGSVLGAVALNGLFLYGIFLSYTFLFLAQWLSGLSVLVGTWLIGFHPLFFHNALKFNTEAPLLAFFLAALYHLKKSERFKSTRHSLLFGIWFFLAFATRPLEMLVYLGVIITLYLFLCYRAKTLLARDLKAFAIAAVGGLGLLVFLMLNNLSFRGYARSGWALLLTIAAIAVIVRKGIPYLAKRFKLSESFLLFWVPAISLSVFWLFPFMPDLFNWAAGSSFTGTTKAPTQRHLIHQFEWMFDKCKYLYGYQALWLAVVAGFTTLIPTFSQKKKPRVTAKMSDWAILTSVLMFPICFMPLFAASFTGNAQSDRYYYPAAVAFLIWLLVVALNERIPYLRVRQAAIAVFVVIQIHFIGMNVLGYKEYDHADSNRLVKWAAGQHPGTHYPWRGVDPLLGIFREILASSDDPKNPSWSWLTNEGYGIDGWLDPDSGTDMLKAEMGLNPKITYFNKDFITTTQNPVEEIARKVEHVLLGPIEFPCATGWSNTPPEDNLTPIECELRAKIAAEAQKSAGAFRFVKNIPFHALHPLNLDFRNGSKVENLAVVHFALYKSKYKAPAVDSGTLAPRAAAPESKINRGPIRSLEDKAAPTSMPGLTLSLSTESLMSLKDGQAVQSWRDSSGVSGLVFSPRDPSSAPKLVSKAVNGLPAVKFEGAEQRLEVDNVKGALVLSPDQATVFAVVKFDSNSKNDGFGWGGCGDNRFMSHFSIDGKAFFMSGSPEKTVTTAPLSPVGWDSGSFHILTLIRDKSSSLIFVDGGLAGSRLDVTGQLNVNASAKFILGKTNCEQPFSGEFAEFLVFKKALSRADQKKIENYLSIKFKLPVYDFRQ